MYQTKLMGKGHLATLLISVILLSTIIATIGLPIVVSKDGQGRTIKGPTKFTSAIVDVIADKTWDLDGDGTDDFRITTRRVIVNYTGVLEGNGTGLMTVCANLHTNIASLTNTVTFYGRVGNSKPGAMTLTKTVISDRSDPTWYKAQGTLVVVEGSGVGGLEGICGGGSFQVAGPPPGPWKATAYYEFRFHSPWWS